MADRQGPPSPPTQDLPAP
ncbi:hypothetical protein E2C01_062472 [Portunus trituberculatus]|uniref:Uncharacterized protein n=1 Tax=Portunus trituberculatus TaxID=210409 RepID=A0A5B7HI45_PORTR|nr:hypothetical protein [Portunus trituberculatus]